MLVGTAQLTIANYIFNPKDYQRIMKANSSPKNILSGVLSTLYLCLCFGCTTAKPANETAPVAIFTSAVETASAKETENMFKLQSTAAAVTLQPEQVNQTATAQAQITQLPTITLIPELNPPTPASGILQQTTTPAPVQHVTQSPPGSETACIPANPPRPVKSSIFWMAIPLKSS